MPKNFKSEPIIKALSLEAILLVKKVWLNIKYIKTKHNQKLEAKLFGPFRGLHPVRKQAYKLEFPKKWRIYDVFHVSLLEQDITKNDE